MPDTPSASEQRDIRASSASRAPRSVSRIYRLGNGFVFSGAPTICPNNDQRQRQFAAGKGFPDCSLANSSGRKEGVRPFVQLVLYLRLCPTQTTYAHALKLACDKVIETAAGRALPAISAERGGGRFLGKNPASRLVGRIGQFKVTNRQFGIQERAAGSRWLNSARRANTPTSIDHTPPTCSSSTP